MRLLLEFIYKGVVQMKEETIENFLEAGKFLKVKGVSVSDNIQIADSEESFSPELPENSAELVFNSTVSSEHSQQVENLREANHLRSFVHDISNIQHRPLVQEVSVNIRRMSKEDTLLHSTHNLDNLNNSLDTSRRSSRMNRSNINYCEDELPVHSTSFSKSSGSHNISQIQSRSRRSLLETTGSEEVDMEELFLLENNEDNFGHCKTLSSTVQIPAARRRSAPAPGGRMECDQCRESIATREMGHHVKTMHRRSRRSLPEPSHSQGGRSVPNLGSLYRTKPLESRRSILAKNNTENTRKNHSRKKSNTHERISPSADKTERLRMMKSLGGEAELLPREVNENADREMVENVNGTNCREQTFNENVISRTNPGTDETTIPSQTNNVSQYPSTPSTQENYNASDFEVSPVAGQQPETEPHPENSGHVDNNETKIGAVDNEVLTTYEISRHIVRLSGRNMCKLCGIQVKVLQYFFFKWSPLNLFQVSNDNPKDHFDSRHPEILMK